MLTNSPKEYGLVSKAIHWLMALLLILLIGAGIYMGQLPKEDPARLQIFATHKSLGVLALALVVLRMLWLRISKAPALPRAFSVREQFLVNGLQTLLYLLMLLVPVAGYTMSVAAGHPVAFFGLHLPNLVNENKDVAGIAHQFHVALAFAMAAVILAHIAGALKHRIKEPGSDTDILKRML